MATPSQAHSSHAEKANAYQFIETRARLAVRDGKSTGCKPDR
jgi:hypothetical protein